MVPALTTTSCPGCGADSDAGAARCASCGFAFFEAPGRPRCPAARLVAGGAAALALAGAAALLLSRDDPAPAPAPAPVPLAAAERKLERGLGLSDYAAVVSCTESIRPGRRSRCHVRYRNDDTQLILVGLTATGSLDVEIPYPAQRRPGP